MLMIIVSSSDCSTSMSRRIDGHPLGQAEDGPDFPPQLVRIGLRPAAQLLDPFGRLGQQSLGLVAGTGAEELVP